MSKKAYSKKDFRELYSISPNTFNIWIAPIMDKLTETGYTKGQRKFTAKQTSLILNHLDTNET